MNVMEGKRVKVESKCDMISCNDGVDRISTLPDKIIVHILSYLRLNLAARTSILSTRWYDLWRYIPTLELIDASFYARDYKLEFIDWVNLIVENHKAPSLKKLIIYCNLDKSSHSVITKWLEFVFSKQVEVMDLYFGYDADKEKAVVLDELLKLRPSTLLESSNLKSLYLGSLKVSGEAIKLILRDCHLLKRLMISNVDFTSDIEVCSGVLKHLRISDYRGGKSIKVSAPNLTYLCIADDDDDDDDDDNERKVLPWVENVPKLVEVDFGSCIASNMQDFCFVSQFQILTIGPFYPRDFLAKGIPTMPKLIELNVCYFGCSKYLVPTLTSLVKASPLLQTFNLKQFSDRKHDYDYEQVMEVGNVEAFKHQHLRVFKFSGFEVEVADHMELVSFILDNCVALRKLIIEVQKIYRKLSPDSKRAEREADMEKVKQLLQPSVPPYVQLQTIISC